VEGLKNDGQWIIMMGFLVSLGIFFLAIIISQSTLVGQTTAEGVLEFPKNDIQDLKHVILEVEYFNRTQGGCPSLGTACGGIMGNISQEIRLISLYRKSAIVNYSFTACDADQVRELVIHYNNGVTVYDENPITIYC
jgi:hypothetical protein